MPAPPKPVADDQAVAFVQTYCGWHIAPSKTETLTLDGGGGNVLVLPSLYVTDVAAITEDGITLDPALDYQWSQAGIVRRSWATGAWSGYSGRWWSGDFRSITVKLTHGYDDWPLDLAAVISTVSDRIKENPSGLEQITVGPFTEKYASSGTAITEGERFVLDGYALPWRLA